MKNTFKTAGTILGIASAIFIISFMVLAWTGPSANPPGENIPAPLNVGTDTQAKQGALGIGGLLTVDRIKIIGGDPGLGKVLTSGEDGLAIWNTPSTGDIASKTIISHADVFSEKGYILKGDFKRVFFTSTTYNGNLGRLTGADQKCQERANAAGLSGNWRAWLSDSQFNARDRIPVGVYMPVGSPTETDYNGNIYINTYISLLPYGDYANIVNPINRTEFGDLITDYKIAWTGTNSNGRYSSFLGDRSTCTNWTQSSSYGAYAGTTTKSDEKWTVLDTLSPSPNTHCSKKFSLYCFEL